MSTIFKKPWTIGFMILLLYVFIGELLTWFDDYVFDRIGVNKNILTCLLWGLPLLASYVASYYSEKRKLFNALSYLVLFPLMLVVVHFVSGELGWRVDFTGMRGAIILFKLYFVIGGVLIVTGALFGLLLSGKSNRGCSGSFLQETRGHLEKPQPLPKKKNFSQ